MEPFHYLTKRFRCVRLFLLLLCGQIISLLSACYVPWLRPLWRRGQGQFFQVACATLSVEDSLRYDKVKSAILRTYELVPEAYRQRSLKKSPPTFVEFAREKGILFDRWCLASIATDFSSLRELILLEEFRNRSREDHGLPQWTGQLSTKNNSFNH